MDRLYISIAECIYLIYMFHFFKTRTDFNIFSSPKNWLFKHLIGNEYSLRICPFGQMAVFGYVFILLGRHIMNIPQSLICFAVGLSILLSLINLNAVIYLLPIWIIEIYYLVN